MVTLTIPTRLLIRTRSVLGFLCLLSWSLPSVGVSQERTGPIVPVGFVRLDFGLSVHAWEDRFGERTSGGATVREVEPVGLDFSSSALGANVFPGIATLEAALSLADPGRALPISMGATDVFLSHERLTMPLRLDVGILPWLAIGGTVPLSRRRSEIFVGVDGADANSGVSPTLTNPGAVSDFLGSLRVATEAAGAAALGICEGAGSGSVACTDAQGIFADADVFRTALSEAYLVSPGFPIDGSDAADALLTKLGSLGQSLSTLGVGGFPTGLPLATTPLDGELFRTIVADEAGTIQGMALEEWRSPWELGDIELFANARILGRSLQLPSVDQSSLRYEVGLGLLARLGTGAADSEDNFIDLGSGDGTTDVEGRIWLNLRKGTRLGLWADARYGVQGSTTLVRRIAAPDRPLAPAAAKGTVQWTPGSYLRAELVPRLHLTDEVALAVSLVRRQKSADEYSLVGAAPTAAPDVSVLSLETEESFTELGFGLTYSSLDNVASRRMEVRFQFAKATSGSGGRTPKGVRIDFGLRLFRSFWAGSPEG